MLPSSTADRLSPSAATDAIAAFRVAIQKAGGALAPRAGDEGLWVLGADGLAQAAPPRSMLLIPFDGRLGPAQADALERNERILFTAVRGERNELAPWEARLIAQFGTRASVLPSCADLQMEVLWAFEQIGVFTQRAEALADAAGAGRAAQDAVIDVVHELLANGLLDAPADDDGRPRYAHRRDEHPDIAPEDGCRLLMGTEEGRMYISVTDRFGRFERAPIVRTLRGLGERAKVDSSGGGAGLGLRRVIDQSDVFAVRVIAGRATEVLSVVSLDEQRRRNTGRKSIYYRIEKG